MMMNEDYETLLLDDEYAKHRIVIGLDIDAYRENVNKGYTGARKAFVQVKACKTSSAGHLCHPPQIPS